MPLNQLSELQMKVRRHEIRLKPDPARVLIRPFIPTSSQRIANIVGRVLQLTEPEVEAELGMIEHEFAGRHQALERVLERHYERVKPHLFSDRELTRARRLLIGSVFTSEYALESAALFNPSIVAHPDQTGVPEGSLRFVMSLRATGEGHISSIEFRSGHLDANGNLSIDPVTRFVTEPEIIPDVAYDKATFALKLDEMHTTNEHSARLLEELGETFTHTQLRNLIGREKLAHRVRTVDETRTLECLQWLAESNYEVRFSADVPICERIIFPVTANESNGIEDARFVRFVGPDGAATYYATYTAYNGRVILPQLITTKDFLAFKVTTLNGRAVENKGMALFPRLIRGKYAMVSRQDNENLYLMFSENIHFWNEAEKLMRPAYPWEFVQLGNCGSPIETPEGWILLTHGVGPMRKYTISAILLDLENPMRIIGRLREPLVLPDHTEREGYVPNVVYTCGAIEHRGTLVIPYAMSDSASSVASIAVSDLLEALKRSGPSA